MSRTFTIKELNEKIDALLGDCRKELGIGDAQNSISPIGRAIISGKIEALEDLKLELNEPEAIVSPDWVNKIQESLNIIETKKIINSMGTNRFETDME